ncbi:hypothetical protein Tco_0590347 [Tanacetum coccineum]
MSSMGELTFFLGLKVMQKDAGIFISQDKYVADILKKFDFVTVKTASTPIKTNKALLKDKEAEDVDVHLYRSMIRSLMYLTAFRPDKMFVVCACARFQVTPKVSHRQAVKRIFRYLKGQPKLGLWYPRDSPFDLEAFSDSDYARASLDRKSTIGAEYFAATNCCRQNPVFHSKTKHIEIKHHFIGDSYKKKLIQVIKIHTDHNVADLLTKAFDVSRLDEKECIIKQKWVKGQEIPLNPNAHPQLYYYLILNQSLFYHNLNQKKTQKPRKAKRTTEISQSSGIHLDANETVHKELGDKIERAATTASSLEAKQDSEAQIRFEAVSKQSNDPPLSRVNTLGSVEDCMKLIELMEHCTKLSELKSEGGEGFHQIIDFLTTSHIKYALTESPTIYVSLIEQFWQTASASTLENGDMEITTIIDGKVKVVSEASIRRHIKLEDSDGISTLPTSEIFEQLALMGNMKRASKGYTGVDTPLFQTMLVQGQILQGEGLTIPVESHHTAISAPSTSQPPTSPPSMHTTYAAEEAATMPHDSPLPRVHSLGSDEGSITLNELTVLCTQLSTKVARLEADLKQTKKVYGNAYTKLIMKVKKLEHKVKSSKARRRAKIMISDDEDNRGVTKVKVVSEASIRRHLKLEDSDGISDLPTTEIFEQLALMGPFPTQTHVADEAASTGVDVRHGGAATTVSSLDAGQGSGNIDKTLAMPHDSPLLRVHSLRSDEGRMQHNELMDLVTKLSDRVVSLETGLQQTNKVYGAAYTKLIKKVKRLEDKLNKSRRKRILTQGRHAHEMEADFEFTTVEDVSTANVSVNTAGLVYIRRSAAKRKNKGKAIMEESNPTQTKTKLQQEQERLEFEEALRLQEQFDEEERQRIASVHKEASTFKPKE